MLEVAGIDLHYLAAHILRGISIEARVGEITCILGRNGVGKTSLLRAIAGQHAVSGGAVRFEGRNLTRAPAHVRARAGMALVPQGREIFPLLTVQENLETGYAAVPRPERFVPATVLELFPVLAAMTRRRGGDLSGGQQQQLAIGRALTMRPRLLLLDEPTEGIQPSIIKEIGAAIRALRAGGSMAIVLVEQYFHFAWELADRIYVLDRGAVVLGGDRASLDAGAVQRAVSV